MGFISQKDLHPNDPPLARSGPDTVYSIDSCDCPVESCHCGFEGTEDEMADHKERCLADGDRAWDSFRDSASDEEMAAFEATVVR